MLNRTDSIFRFFLGYLADPCAAEWRREYVLDFMPFLVMLCSTDSNLILRISDYAGSHSKSRALYIVMGLHYERSTHQVICGCTSFLLNS